MFSSLFYSKSKNIYKKQVHANAFKNKYPTITKILRHYKKTFKDQCIEREITKYHKGEYIAKIQIAHKMMQIESYLFTSILKQLFKIKDFYGVAIHDAIAVLDNSIPENVVIDIIQKKYNEIGLCPTVSVKSNIDEYEETLYDDVENDVNMQ